MFKLNVYIQKTLRRNEVAYNHIYFIFIFKFEVTNILINFKGNEQLL